MSKWNNGDRVVLKYDDALENQPAIGKVGVVVKNYGGGSPHWVDLEVEGNTYTVWGNDCREAK